MQWLEVLHLASILPASDSVPNEAIPQILFKDWIYPPENPSPNNLGSFKIIESPKRPFCLGIAMGTGRCCTPFIITSNPTNSGLGSDALNREKKNKNKKIPFAQT